jgi:HEPN domain-containing protein
MANKTYAKEWLLFSKKNLDTAKLLFKVDHYTDIIGVEIQQSLEKLLKSVIANENIKIPKEHDLIKLYFMIDTFINIEEDELLLLRMATNYYKEYRYPNPNYSVPSRKEIEEVLWFTEKFFSDICKKLEINKEDIIK